MGQPGGGVLGTRAADGRVIRFNPDRSPGLFSCLTSIRRGLSDMKDSLDMTKSQSAELTTIETIGKQEATGNDADVAWGCREISKAINATERRTFYLLQNSLLPAKRVGGRWCASRRRLREFFES
jgi:hypothetical protein